MVVSNAEEEVAAEVVEEIAEVLLRDKPVLRDHRHQKAFQNIFGRLYLQRYLLLAVVIEVKLTVPFDNYVHAGILASLWANLNASIAPPPETLVVVEL